jgi:hypothetical protein
MAGGLLQVDTFTAERYSPHQILRGVMPRCKNLPRRVYPHWLKVSAIPPKKDFLMVILARCCSYPWPAAGSWRMPGRCHCQRRYYTGCVGRHCACTLSVLCVFRCGECCSAAKVSTCNNPLAPISLIVGCRTIVLKVASSRCCTVEGLS